ncbi:MAG: transporter substrate-binding domain-containing protein [Pseudomonadota bacterium]
MFLWISGWCIVSAATVHAGADLEAHARHRPPEMTVDQNGIIGGPLYMILNEAARRAGISVIWIAKPFARSLAELQQGREVIVPRTFRTDERAIYIDFTISILDRTKKVEFFYDRNRPVWINQYDDLYGYLIGVKRGTSYFARFDADTVLATDPVPDDTLLVRLLAAGRIDVVASVDRAAFEQTARVHQYQSWVASDYSFTEITETLYAMKKGSLYYNRLNAALQAMITEGTIAEIYNLAN